MKLSRAENLGFEEKTASLHELSMAVENLGERDLDFWRVQFDQSVDNFDRSISEVHETRKTVIEFLKIDLLLGSLIAAFYQYGIVDTIDVSGIYLGLPFIPLLGSAIVLIYTLFSLWKYVIGPSSGGYLQHLKEENTEKEYYRTMTSVHYKWADKNAQVTQTASNWITWGITMTFASLGTLAGIYVFL